MLIDGIVFCLEFKVGESKIIEVDVDQVLDYALDLKYFHKFSNAKSREIKNQKKSPPVSCAKSRKIKNAKSREIKNARIQVISTTSTGFKINLYISEQGAYASSDISGKQLYSTKLASSVSGVSYKLKYKRIM